MIDETMITLPPPSASISPTDGTVLMTFNIPPGFLEEVRKKNDRVSMDLLDEPDHKRQKYHHKCQEHRDNQDNHEDKIHKDRKEDQNHKNCLDHKSHQDHQNQLDHNNHHDHKNHKDHKIRPDHKTHSDSQKHGKPNLELLESDKSSSSAGSQSLRSGRKRWREIGDKDREEFKDKARRAVRAHLHSLKTTYLQLQRVS